MIKLLPILGILIFIFSIAGGWYYLGAAPKPKEQTSETPLPIGTALPSVTKKEVSGFMPPITATSASKVDVNDTSDWKIHTNQTFHYQLSYPQTMIKKPVPSLDLLRGGDAFALDYKDGEWRPQSSEVYVDVYDSQGLSLTDWFTEHTSSQFDDSKVFYLYRKISDGTLNSMPTIQFQNEFMDYKTTNSALKKDNYIYVIGTVTVSEDLSADYQKMLKTFKFIN